jgi:hypothetical protein
MRILFRSLLTLLLVFTAGCAPERRLEAALLLGDLAAGDGPSRYKRQTATPQRTAVAFTSNGRSYAADLYRSPAGTVAPLLLIAGAAEEGKDDPRLVAFATTLARARFAVLVPELPGVRAQRVEAENAREIADAFAWLISRPELAPAGRGGLAAFSYAAGPAVLAAMEGAIRDRVQFILAVGGYYDLPETLAFIATGWFRHGGTWRYLEPNAYGTWVFVRGNLHRVVDAGDRDLLLAMAERRTADPAAAIEDLAAGLGPEGKSLYDFLVNRDPRRAPLLLRHLPPSIRGEIAALDLAGRDLHPLRAKLLLVHGYEDNIIPFAQSVALDRAVPADQAGIFLVHGLMHVDLDPGPSDLWRLWRAVDALLAERDVLARQRPPPAMDRALRGSAQALY